MNDAVVIAPGDEPLQVDAELLELAEPGPKRTKKDAAKDAAAGLSHEDLTRLGVRWLRNQQYIAFREPRSIHGNESPDVIGWRHSGTSVLLECKRTREDFKRDREKVFRKYSDLGMGVLRYFLCPAGLLMPDEMPERWGLLWAYNNRVVLRKQAVPFDTTKAAVAEKKILTALLYQLDGQVREVCQKTGTPVPYAVANKTQ